MGSSKTKFQLVVLTFILSCRLVQPFGYGDQNPVATNATSEGRAQNRRVEIKVMVNKGTSAQASL